MIDDTPGAVAAPAAPAVDDEFWSDAAPIGEQGVPPEAPASERRPPTAEELLAQPPVPPAAQPPAPAPPPAPPAVAGAPAAAPPPAAPEAWSFKADGNQIAVDGSSKNPDGSLTIPAKHIEQIEQLLAEGVAHRGSWRGEQEKYESRIAELEAKLAAPNPEMLRAKAFSDNLLALLDSGPDKVAEWLDGHATTFPKFKAEAETALLRADLDQRDAELNQLREERQAQELTPVLQNTVVEAVRGLATRYPGVDAEKLYNRVTTRYLDDVAYEVPAAQRQRGLNAGEVLIGRGPKDQLYIVNTGLIEDEFKYQADLLKGSASAAQAAVATNAAVAAPAAGMAPAVPTAAGVPPNLAEGEAPLFKTKKEMEDWIESGAWRNAVFKER